MGDRGNIRVKQNYMDNTADNIYIYLYTHWDGSNLPGLVQTTLRKQKRWDDESYLTRMLFSELLKRMGPDVLDEETEFGISAYPTDNEHAYVDVDVKSQSVAVGDRSWSFNEFIELDIESEFEDY